MNQVDFCVTAGAALLVLAITVKGRRRLWWAHMAAGLVLLGCACLWSRTLAMRARTDEVVLCIQRMIGK